jgi:hypothetical protein
MFNPDVISQNADQTFCHLGENREPDCVLYQLHGDTDRTFSHDAYNLLTVIALKNNPCN